MASLMFLWFLLAASLDYGGNWSWVSHPPAGSFVLLPLATRRYPSNQREKFSRASSFQIFARVHILTSHKSKQVTLPSPASRSRDISSSIERDAKNLWPYFAVYHRETVNKQLNRKQKSMSTGGKSCGQEAGKGECLENFFSCKQDGEGSFHGGGDMRKDLKKVR